MAKQKGDPNLNLNAYMYTCTCMQWKQDQNTGIVATVHVSPDCRS